ncbi:SRPBCC family protein [Flavitalea sp. BT771]|uniref:SRPBCC family protein n=1 Tax=Flavitalea sp. BT771 TaxID=3063329 RepID=UPI0026E17AF5|nr:SRPBCC family protein [Flavitalea sp. BT771]MDO6431283.1 SRPBCC family protein [Flavitalea sp. BT771]MDV6220191.1 SRPBCC family protein [Flavitalea sp. BT771]
MRIIKLLLISAIVLFGVMTALSLLFPSRLRLSRAVNIAVPREKVYAAIGDLRQWEEWNAFIRATPLTGKTYSSPATGKGAYLHADQLVLTLVTSAPDSVALDWRLSTGKHFEGGYNILQSGSDSITIQSWFDFHFRWYPWEKLGILVYDKQFGPLMEESLAGLKQYLEKTP